MNQNIIAYQGEIEILDASWSLRDGRQVTFRLCGEPYGRVHPFKQYQQRRGGKVGTRFRASFARSSTGEAINTFDLMLASWKDSSTAGQQVTFWIDDEPEAHPFCGCSYRQNGTPGEIFAVALVELNDDDTPIDQAERQSVESGVGASRAITAGAEVSEGTGPDPVHSRGSKSTVRNQAPAKGSSPRKLSSSAHLLVSSPLFLRYLQETKSNLLKDWTSEKAKIYAKGLIKVESLSDLDRNADAARQYHDLIRRPFDRWYRQEP